MLELTNFWFNKFATQQCDACLTKDCSRCPIPTCRTEIAAMLPYTQEDWNSFLTTVVDMTPTMIEGRPYLTIKQFAKRRGVTRQRVSQLISDGINGLPLSLVTVSGRTLIEDKEY